MADRKYILDGRISGEDSGRLCDQTVIQDAKKPTTAPTNKPMIKFTMPSAPIEFTIATGKALCTVWYGGVRAFREDGSTIICVNEKNRTPNPSEQAIIVVKELIKLGLFFAGSFFKVF